MNDNPSRAPQGAASATPLAANRWFVLAVLYAARIIMGFQFQTVGPISPLLVEALAIDYAELGTLIGFYMLPGVFLALPSGILGRRYGDTNMVLSGLLAMGIGGLIMGYGDTYAVVSLGRILGGGGAIFLNVLMVKMIADWFGGKELFVAMAILISSWPMGIGIGLVSFPAIALMWSWQAVMYLSAGLAFASFGLMIWKYRPPPNAVDGRDEGFRIGLLPREWLLILLCGMVWGFFNVGFIILLSFGSDIFVALGYSLGDAGYVVSLAGWISIIMVPMGGYIAGRFGHVNWIMTLCFVASAAGMLWFGQTSSPITLFIFVSMIGVFPAAMIVALPPEVLRPNARGAGLGLFFMLFYVCMAVLPGIAGWTRDLTGDPVAPFYFGAFMMICSLISLIPFRILQKRLPVPVKG